MENSSIKLVVDNKPLANGHHRVYLRIIKNRKKKIISLGLECKMENFKNRLFTKNHPNYQIENELLLMIKTNALKTLRSLQLTSNDFSLEEFENNFRNQKKDVAVNVIVFFNEIIDEMMCTGRIGNAKAFKTTRDSLIKFKGDKIYFKDITSTFLDKYEVYLRETSNSNGGVAFKMRELRSIFNKARQRKLIPKEPYPFEDYKISKLKSITSKRALSIEDFRKFKNVDLTFYPNLLEAYRYFMFSIYTRGMNFKDMMHLKWSDISNNRIHYTRSKTKTRFNLEIIENAQEILDYYRNQNRGSEYVFPILLKDDMSPVQIANRHHKVLKRYNTKLKLIAKLAEIDIKLTSYVARHSFATILKMNGSSIEKISEMMGHANVSVTMSYLKEFSNEDLDYENRKWMNI